MKLKRDEAKPQANGIDMGSILNAQKEVLAHTALWVAAIGFYFLFGGFIPYGWFFIFMMVFDFYFTFNRMVDRATLGTTHLAFGGVVTTVATSLGSYYIPEYRDPKDGRIVIPRSRVYVPRSIDGSRAIPALTPSSLNPGHVELVIVPVNSIEDVNNENKLHIVRNADVIMYSDRNPPYTLSALPDHIISHLRGFPPPFGLPRNTRNVTVWWVRGADPVPDKIKELIDTLRESGFDDDAIKEILQSSTRVNANLLEADLSNTLRDILSNRKMAEGEPRRQPHITQTGGEEDGTE
ncbi:MAG: hypothetical protein J7L32_05275 [Thermoplasmata archaeon]|nr:hypothetical protein [Thermoplasmata archaeon]